MLLRRTITAMSARGGRFRRRPRRRREARGDRTTSRRGTARSKASAPSGGARDWILENRLVDAVGRRISTSSRRHSRSRTPSSRGVEHSEITWLSLGWRRAITYQPNDRFWTFQAIEAGLFFALGALAVLGTISARAQDAGVIDQFDRSGLLRRAGSPALALAALGGVETQNAAAAGGSCGAIHTGASSSSTTPPRTRSSCPRATGSPMRRRSSESTFEWTR